MAQAKRSKKSSGKSASNRARRAAASSRSSSQAPARTASSSRAAGARASSGRRRQKRRNGGASTRNAQPDAQNRWSTQDDRDLKTLIKQNTPTRVMGLKLGRTQSAVRQHAYKLGLSLRPTNRSPYG